MDRVELRLNILTLLKNYEDQRQAWILQATSERLAEVEALEEATKEITFSIIEKLDFETEENGAVFWTGYTLENQRTAMAFAREQGKKTIEMTRDGKLLDQLGMYKPDSPIAASGKSKLGDLLFDAASRKFAESAHGKITAVIYKPEAAEQEAAYARSAYNRIEEPILLEREQRGELVLGKGRVEVPVEITLPALRELIKENANKTKGLHLIGTFANRVAAGEFSREEMENFEHFLDQSQKKKTFSQNMFSSGVTVAPTKKNNDLPLIKKLELARKAHEQLERKRQSAHTLSNLSFGDWKLPFDEEKKEISETSISIPAEIQDQHRETHRP